MGIATDLFFSATYKRRVQIWFSLSITDWMEAYFNAGLQTIVRKWQSISN